MIYLDYAASTPVDPAVVDAMSVPIAARGNYANPSSTDSEGRHRNELIAEAAGKLAGLLHTSPDRLIWTSGATESDNLAIFGAASYRADRGRHRVKRLDAALGRFARNEFGGHQQAGPQHQGSNHHRE